MPVGTSLAKLLFAGVESPPAHLEAPAPERFHVFKIETRYTLHATAVLARRSGLVPNSVLAEQLEVSLPMVAKVLNRLVRGGLVESRPGPGGGYCLAKPAAEILLMDVVVVGEGPDWGQRCLLGLPDCNDDKPCAMHDVWGRLRGRIYDMLNKHTVADMAAGEVGIDFGAMPPTTEDS